MITPATPSDRTVRLLRIFVSSPSDVAEERAVLSEVVDMLNDVDGRERGLRLELFRWEDRVVPRLGPDPQAVVDAQMEPYDIYLGIMATRFGTPTERYGSGTEHELRAALDRWAEVGEPWIMFYFKDAPLATTDPEVVEGYARVCAFRREMEEKGIVASYAQVRGASTGFYERVYQHLRKIVRQYSPRPPPDPGPAASVAPQILFTSTSPRRRALLEQIGFRPGSDFVMVHASVGLKSVGWRGGVPTLERAEEAALRTARRKVAHAVNQMHALTTHGLDPARSVVVGADTVVFCEDRLLDRPMLMALEFAGPRDVQNAIDAAKEMLSRESGKQIHVITGLVIARADDLAVDRSATVTTVARMRHFSAEEADRYVTNSRPFDKAGAFGIQERGVALFEGISGSYTNVVGLPLVEFVELLTDDAFGGRVVMPDLPAAEPEETEPSRPELSLVSVGDINLDVVCTQLPEGALVDTEYPGQSATAEVGASAGGSAVHMARAAKQAGFTHCSVVGVVGGDVFGQMIEDELRQAGIRSVLPRDPGQETGIAILLREAGERSRSLTVTHARQGLPSFVADRSRADIESCDALHVSGQCLTDLNRRATAREVATLAKRADRLVVLDAVDDMDGLLPFAELQPLVRDPRTGGALVDLLVARLPEVCRWLAIDDADRHDLGDLEWLRTSVLSRLHPDFPAVLLRDADSSREVLSSPAGLIGPLDVSCSTTGRRTDLVPHACHVAGRLFDFLSPRIVLASRSPQRRALLGQLIAPNKIEVRPSRHSEDGRPGEEPADRVRRLALEKAELVLEAGDVGETTELVIGADTEIVVETAPGIMEVVGHPASAEEAVDVLGRLAGREHRAVSGLAVIGPDPADPTRRKTVADTVCTRVWFRSVSREEVERYAQTLEPLGRAGGYAIQGLGCLLVERLEGSYSNVVGLPLEHLATVLRDEFDRSIWDMDAVSSWALPRPLP